ncbi:MAG TPA: hypothetical protein VNJ04_13195 [Gemmatimonadaceae bacterium]|nr:hypothetical protein [Gemmatimonadaceae bacterium]
MTSREFRVLFPEFNAPSWSAWNAIDDAVFGLEPSDRALVERVTGRTVLPSAPIAELWMVKGRGGGGSRFTARTATFFATARDYRRAAGENVYVGIFGPDRKQGRVTFRYVRELIRSVPALDALVVRDSADSVELSNGVVVEVLTASTSAPRGRSYALAIVEEAAFLPNETAADPDTELLRAIRPALARVPGSLLAVISSPYAKRGELYRVWRDGFGRNEDRDRLVVVADTITLNPTFSQREIDRAFREDPASARSEYGRDGVIEFRSDVSALLTEDALAAVVAVGVRERAPERGRVARGHCDAATGSGEDAMAIAVAFDGSPADLACVRVWRPSFDPGVATAEAAQVFKDYGIRTITIDRFAPGLVQHLFRQHGIVCRIAERDTSATFIELLAAINSRRITLLDDPTLLMELRRLERRPNGSGRELVGHPPRGHDDAAAAAANALLQADVGRLRHFGDRVGNPLTGRWMPAAAAR